ELTARVQEQLDQAAVRETFNKAKAKWNTLQDPPANSDALRRLGSLVEYIQKQKVAPETEVKQFVEQSYQSAQVPLQQIEEFVTKSLGRGGRRDVTGEDIQRIKDYITRVGSLEFRILANNRDDKETVDKVVSYFRSAKDDLKTKEELED